MTTTKNKSTQPKQPEPNYEALTYFAYADHLKKVLDQEACDVLDTLDLAASYVRMKELEHRAKAEPDKAERAGILAGKLEKCHEQLRGVRFVMVEEPKI